MSAAGRDEGGVRRVRRVVTAPPGRGSAEEKWDGANEAKVEKLRGKSLQRLAGGQGLQLRHSAYGFALIDTARKHVDGRNDMTLDEVESFLQSRSGA